MSDEGSTILSVLEIALLEYVIVVGMYTYIEASLRRRLVDVRIHPEAVSTQASNSGTKLQ